MIPHKTLGTGISGSVRYVMGEGKRDLETGLVPQLAPGESSRVAWYGGTGFGFEIDNPERIDIARRMMEWAALPHMQASKTKRCVYDCLNISLSWDRDERPDRAEMEAAARAMLKQLGLEEARAIWVAHNDTRHAHLHLVISRIHPRTGRTFSDSFDTRAMSAWALAWEREHGEVRCEARLDREQQRIERDPDKVLNAFTARRETFTAFDLNRVLSQAIPARDARRQFIGQVLARSDLIRLADPASGQVLRYTMRQTLEAEHLAAAASERLFADHSHAVTTRSFNSVVKSLRGAGKELRADQLEVLRHATGAEGLAVVTGKAGTGKSFTLSAIAAAYKAERYAVQCLAPTNKVASALKRDGLEAGTLHGALGGLDRGRMAWNNRTLIMIDEAAMVSTRVLARVLSYAEHAGAKVIVVGDERQLASMDRGGMFGYLAERYGAGELSEIIRQRGAEQRELAMRASRYDFAGALTALDAQGGIVRVEKPGDRIAKTAELWAARTAQAPEAALFVVAVSNADAQAANLAIRAIRRARGELGADHRLMTADGPQEFAPGDRVLFSGSAAAREAREAGLTNGNGGTIARIEGNRVSVALDSGRPGELLTFTVGGNREAGEFNALRLGYAGTIYKAQGATYDHALVIDSPQMRASSAYVALTRHKEGVTVITAPAHKLGLDSWMTRQGGLAALTPQQRVSAAKSYEKWCEARPEAGRRHDLGDYVGYVQGKAAERRAQGQVQAHDSAEIAKRWSRIDDRRAASRFEPLDYQPPAARRLTPAQVRAAVGVEAFERDRGPGEGVAQTAPAPSPHLPQPGAPESAPPAAARGVTPDALFVKPRVKVAGIGVAFSGSPPAVDRPMSEKEPDAAPEVPSRRVKPRISITAIGVPAGSWTPIPPSAKTPEPVRPETAPAAATAKRPLHWTDQQDMASQNQAAMDALRRAAAKAAPAPGTPPAEAPPPASVTMPKPDSPAAEAAPALTPSERLTATGEAFVASPSVYSRGARIREAPGEDLLQQQADREAHRLKELYKQEQEAQRALAQEQEQRAQAFRRQQALEAEEAKKKQAEHKAAEDRLAREGDISSASARYAIALGQSYDIRDPYGSLARAAMAEYAMFHRNQEKLREKMAREPDADKRRVIDLRRQIEACDYMAITSARLAGISVAITGRQDGPQAVSDRQRAADYQAQASTLRTERGALIEAIQQRVQSNTAPGRGPDSADAAHRAQPAPETMKSAETARPAASAKPGPQATAAEMPGVTPQRKDHGSIKAEPVDAPVNRAPHAAAKPSEPGRSPPDAMKPAEAVRPAASAKPGPQATAAEMPGVTPQRKDHGSIKAEPADGPVNRAPHDAAKPAAPGRSPPEAKKPAEAVRPAASARPGPQATGAEMPGATPQRKDHGSIKAEPVDGLVNRPPQNAAKPSEPGRSPPETMKPTGAARPEASAKPAPPTPRSTPPAAAPEMPGVKPHGKDYGSLKAHPFDPAASRPSQEAVKASAQAPPEPVATAARGRNDPPPSDRQPTPDAAIKPATAAPPPAQARDGASPAAQTATPKTSTPEHAAGIVDAAKTVAAAPTPVTADPWQTKVKIDGAVKHPDVIQAPPSSQVRTAKDAAAIPPAQQTGAKPAGMEAPQPPRAPVSVTNWPGPPKVTIDSGLKRADAIQAPPSPHVTMPKTPAESGLMVADSQTGALSRLTDFVRSLPAATPAPERIYDKKAFLTDPIARKEQQKERVAAVKRQEVATQALGRIHDDIQNGRPLKGDDVKSLTPVQQQIIATRGDEGMKQMASESIQNTQGQGRGGRKEDM